MPKYVAWPPTRRQRTEFIRPCCDGARGRSDPHRQRRRSDRAYRTEPSLAAPAVDFVLPNSKSSSNADEPNGIDVIALYATCRISRSTAFCCVQETARDHRRRHPRACIFRARRALLGCAYPSRRMDLVAYRNRREIGARVLPFPLADDYDELLKSDVADVKPCAIESDAGQILADLCQRDPYRMTFHGCISTLRQVITKAGAHVPTDVTGFGMRLTLDFLRERQLPPSRRALPNP